MPDTFGPIGGGSRSSRPDGFRATASAMTTWHSWRDFFDWTHGPCPA